MKPTMHLRWDMRYDYKMGDVLIPAEVPTLQQFVEIAEDESDITLPREVGPDGVKGRWMDVATRQPKP